MTVRNRMLKAAERRREQETQEWLAQLQAGGHDGYTLPDGQWEGASDVGVMTEADVAGIARVREAGHRAWDQHRGVLGLPLSTRLHHDTDPTPTADATARGWPRLFTIRCAFTQQPRPNQQPCQHEHTNPGAGTFLAHYQSAYDAGWRLDELLRWACWPCQMASAYRTRWPVSVWSQDAADARLRRDPDAEWHASTVAAEALRERTWVHYDESHRRGGHAAGGL